jgi:hypothetical protein
MVLLQNLFDTTIRVNIHYTFNVDKILPPRLSYVHYKILPFVSRLSMGFSFLIFFLKVYYPLFWLTVSLYLYGGNILSLYFIFIAAVEIWVSFYVYRNIHLFFPSPVSRVKSNPEPSLINETSIMVLKLAAKPVVKVIMGSIGVAVVLDTAYTKLFPGSLPPLAKVGEIITTSWLKKK